MKHFVAICCGEGSRQAQQMVAPRPKNRSFRQTPSAGPVYAIAFIGPVAQFPESPVNRLRSAALTKRDICKPVAPPAGIQEKKIYFGGFKTGCRWYTSPGPEGQRGNSGYEHACVSS